MLFNCTMASGSQGFHRKIRNIKTSISLHIYFSLFLPSQTLDPQREGTHGPVCPMQGVRDLRKGIVGVIKERKTFCLQTLVQNTESNLKALLWQEEGWLFHRTIYKTFSNVIYQTGLGWLGGISAFINFHHVSRQLASFKLLWSNASMGEYPLWLTYR